MADHDEFVDHYLENLGKRIKSLRKQQGYTNYEHFAFKHEINRVQFGRYENGKDLRFSTLLKVIKALGMTPQEFFSEGFNDFTNPES